MKALPFLCSVSLKLYIFFNTYLICDNYSVHKVVKQLENYLEEIFMSKLLRELTDKEIQTSLSNGGSTCSMYKALSVFVNIVVVFLFSTYQKAEPPYGRLASLSNRGRITFSPIG
ncbi:hypothetical protein HMPREF0346_2755 [Enterococcus faecalis EnGen0297]|nr:hypothetical protein HMPREF0346_2755 [Enterococcus faecalis EnGen0297]